MRRETTGRKGREKEGEMAFVTKGLSTLFSKVTKWLFSKLLLLKAIIEINIWVPVSTLLRVFKQVVRSTSLL